MTGDRRPASEEKSMTTKKKNQKPSAMKKATPKKKPTSKSAKTTGAGVGDDGERGLKGLDSPREVTSPAPAINLEAPASDPVKARQNWIAEQRGEAVASGDLVKCRYCSNLLPKPKGTTVYECADHKNATGTFASPFVRE
jgi:hypothetical protein